MVLFVRLFVRQILDHEQEVTSATGKGHVVIPAFMFFRDRTGDDDDKHSVRGERPPIMTTWRWDRPWVLHKGVTVRGSYMNVGLSVGPTWRWDRPWALHEGATVRGSYVSVGPYVGTT